VVPRAQEFLEAGEAVTVVPLGRGRAPVDLVAIGSHCTGLDMLLGILGEAGHTSKTIWVGSQGGLTATGRGECDLAGIHLLDSGTGEYNRPFLPPGVRLLEGYGRMQGVLFRPGDTRFQGRDPRDAIRKVREDSACLMVNRNRGSGTRVLIDEHLQGRRPAGYAIEARSHNAVAAAVAQGRADWGVGIAPVAAAYGLGFLPLREERYDFAIPESRWDRPAVATFRDVLSRPDVRQRLEGMGFRS
jgi:putative molybdopterin biosynthesis protein